MLQRSYTITKGTTKTTKDPKQITVWQNCLGTETFTNKETMVKIMNAWNSSTGAWAIDIGEATKKDTTTIRTGRYYTLENRGQTRASTGLEIVVITQTIEKRIKRGRWIWHMAIWRERDKEKDNNTRRQYESINTPTDEFKYAYNHNYNRYNNDDKYVSEEDHDCWYANK